MSKDKYKVRNWRKYNLGLKQRGSINIWVKAEDLAEWENVLPTCQRGRRKRYSDLAILTCLTVRKVYHMPLRQAEGLMGSLFDIFGIQYKVPDYTTLCRRASSLEVVLSRITRNVTDIAVDSTGLKVYGEGEWKVRKHGWNKHRRWMKLHISVDVNTQQIAAVELTSNSIDDAAAVAPMLETIERDSKVNRFYGDGAYDKNKVRQRLWESKITQVIPPQHNAIKSKGKTPYLYPRDECVQTINSTCRKQWKLQSDYHKRSLSETVMYRYKTILGHRLQARNINYQKTEVMLGCKILNEMLLLAKPQSVKVA